MSTSSAAVPMSMLVSPSVAGIAEAPSQAGSGAAPKLTSPQGGVVSMSSSLCSLTKASAVCVFPAVVHHSKA